MYGVVESSNGFGLVIALYSIEFLTETAFPRMTIESSQSSSQSAGWLVGWSTGLRYNSSVKPQHRRRRAVKSERREERMNTKSSAVWPTFTYARWWNFTDVKSHHHFCPHRKQTRRTAGVEHLPTNRLAPISDAPTNRYYNTRVSR